MHSKFRPFKLSMLLFLWIFSTSFDVPADHKFYFSHSTIQLNNQTQRVEWIVKIFYDDLELAIGRRSGTKVSFFQQNANELNPLVDAYLQEVIAVKCNDQFQAKSFIGYELQGELVICYIEFPMTGPVHTLELKNAILVNEFDDQRNVMQVEYNGSTQTLLCNKQTDTATVFF